MAAHANPTPIPNLLPRPASASGRWDEIVIATFAFLGVGSGTVLALCNKPPIVASFLIATGLAALTYRYLGGTEGSSLRVGALKLTGSVAVLVGIALIINKTLAQQTAPSAQVWYVHGKVRDEVKNGIDRLEDTDFTLFPALAHAGQLGDFHVAFIRDDSAAPGANKSYLQVVHSGFDQATVPLELADLKDQYPNATIENHVINVDIQLHKSLDAPYANDAPPLQRLQQEKLSAYTAAARSAKPANPSSSGVPQ